MAFVKTDDNGVVIQKSYPEPAESGWIEAPDDAVPGFTYDGAKFHHPGVSEENFWNKIRGERNRLLEASDKYLLPDFPTDATQSEIESYRQALRDLPQNYDDPDAVEWPSKPEGINV